MTVQGELRETTITITGVEGATSTNGTPQWKIHCRWFWTPARNEGGDQVWVNRASFPTWGPDTRGKFHVQIQARGCKTQSKAKQEETGQKYYDGTLDWMWQWDVIQILDHEPTVAPSSNGTSNAAPTPQSGDLAQRIAWNSAINNAVTLFSHSEIRKDDWLDVLDYEKIKHIAGRVYNMILAGPPQTEAEIEPVWSDPRDGPDGSETPVQPVSAPVASKRQRPPAKSSEAKMQELEAARTDANGIEICSPDTVVQYIASTYDERGPRDLTEAEVNQVIDAIRCGDVCDPEPVDPEPVDPEPVGVAQLPF